jgi:hypothetical protein
VSLLSELAGRGDRLINMHIESGWLTAAPLSCPGGSPAGEAKGIAIVTLSPGVCEKEKVTELFFFSVIGWLVQRTRVGFLKGVLPQ